MPTGGRIDLIDEVGLAPERPVDGEFHGAEVAALDVRHIAPEQEVERAVRIVAAEDEDAHLGVIEEAVLYVLVGQRPVRIGDELDIEAGWPGVDLEIDRAAL